MKTYKDIRCLKARCEANEGRKVEVWDDEGIKVGGKIYRQMEYGTVDHNIIEGISYVTFRNTGRRGRQPTYANRNPATGLDTWITITYRLLRNEQEADSYVNNIFHFIQIEFSGRLA